MPARPVDRKVTRQGPTGLSDFIGVMERKYEIGPAATTKRAMGTRLPFDLPPDPKQRR